MSFKEMAQAKVNPSFTPIFLLPDITGDCITMTNIATRLIELFPGSPIYIWNDPAPALTSTGTPRFASLEAYAAHIKDEIQKKLGEGLYHIAGYSFGGAVAASVGQQLRAVNCEVSTVIIDAPPVAVNRAYLQPNNPAATHDLIAIFNHAFDLAYCRLLSPKKLPNPLNYADGASFAALCTKSIPEQIQALSTALSAYTNKLFSEQINFTVEQIQSFMLQLSDYIATIRQNLNFLMHSQSSSSIPASMLSHLCLIYTDESREKYGNLDKSWSYYCPQIQSHGLALKHVELMNYEQAAVVVEPMQKYFQASELNKLARRWVDIVAPKSNLAAKVLAAKVQSLRDDSQRYLLSSSPPIAANTTTALSAPNSPAFFSRNALLGLPPQLGPSTTLTSPKSSYGPDDMVDVPENSCDSSSSSNLPRSQSWHSDHSHSPVRTTNPSASSASPPSTSMVPPDSFFHTNPQVVAAAAAEAKTHRRSTRANSQQKNQRRIAGLTPPTFSSRP